MIEILKKLFDKYKIDYTAQMLEQLDKFYKLVVEKNQFMNLTNITEPNDFAIKNILDSVLPIKTIPYNVSLCDVGAGAGFPSIPLKILRPDLKITMVDSLNKRIVFLNEVIKALDLDGIIAVHARVEDFCKTNREQFDVTVARAVSRLNTLSEYCLPLTKVGGFMIAYKSLKADEEIVEAKNAITTLGGKIESQQTVMIKEIESIRINVIIKKISPTPNKYPRPKNLPKTTPL